MDSQFPRPQGPDSNQVMEGEEDNRQEKTSMLKKVKAKARKIKDTIKAKAGHDRQDTDGSHEEDEDAYDEDEEMVEDSEAQDAVPMYESPAVMSTMAEQKPDDKLEKPATVAEDQPGSEYTDPQTRPFLQWPDSNTGNSTGMGMAGGHVLENKQGSFSSSGTFGTPGSESAGNFVLGEGGHMGHPKLSMETPKDQPEVPNYQSEVADQTEAGHMEHPKISTEIPTTTMEEDPHAPDDRPEVPNYQSKVADPTGAGGEEAGITQVLQSFNKMNVSGEPESKSEGAPELNSGSHDQFLPESIPPTSTNPEDTPLDNVTKLPSNQSSYTEKISYAGSAIADKAIAAKNVVVSKLGYGCSNIDPNAESKAATQGVEETGKTGTMAEYGQKTVAAVTEKLTPVYDKVSNSVVTPLYEKVSNVGSSVVTPVYEKASNVGSSVVSKVRGTSMQQDAAVEGQDQGVSVKDYLAEKLRPGDEDKALSDKILGTFPSRKQEVDEEEEENEKPPMGIVTESEEVRNRLGNDEDNREMTETESKVAGNVSATGKGMVESLKGTVSSWFSKGGDQKQSSEASPVTMPEQERDSSSNGEEALGRGENGVGERRLQESSN